MPDTGGVRRALLLLPLALATACSGQIGAGNPSGNDPHAITLSSGVFQIPDRDPAPTLSGTTLEGTQLDVRSLLGKVVVVNFWASWCNPCRAEADNLNQVYAQTKGLGVAFVGVDIKDDRTAARAFERTKKVSYPSLFDADGALLLRFRASAPQNPPTTLVLDRRGRVAARFVQGVTVGQLLAPVQVIAKEPG
ncbi:MAG: resA2 [Frankiales bacterium]|jgi:peroxiredoxin|nr:resA2 [Frankiales bacterium]